MIINIGGDVCINEEYLSKNIFDDDIITLFKESDYNIVNLECPIIENRNELKILKTGPNLRTNNKILDQLKKININAVTLANNHILDYGEHGLKNTMDECDNYKIAHVGAGIDFSRASKPLIIEHDDIKIGFVNFCENEWSSATLKTGGANPMNIIKNFNQIHNLKKIVDFVIVIIHGGHEYYNLPSPRMVEQYRFYSENGADAIIAHHTHCISGFEIYNDVPIVYSLGNMLFTHKSKNSSWYIGLIAQLKIVKNNPIRIELVPIQQSTDTFKLSLVEGQKKIELLENLHDSSLVINSPSRLEDFWEDFLLKREYTINIFSPIQAIPGRYMRAALRKLGINKIIMKKSYLAEILNHIRCEAHRDVVSQLIIKKLFK